LGALKRPFTFEVLQAREHTPTAYPFVVFTFGFVVEFIKEFQVRQKPLEFKR
jgi:hypothetical protein